MLLNDAAVFSTIAMKPFDEIGLLAELPDLGPAFNDLLTWQVHAALDAAARQV